MTESPNVLLVVMDSVRARNTSLHGHTNETTPFLQSFADDSATVYTQARSPSSWSLPSHVSLFTGLHLPEHRVSRSTSRLEPGTTVFEALGDDGYATGVFSENTWLTEMPVGIKDAFETVEGARNVPFPEALHPTDFVMSEGEGQYAAYLREALAGEHPLKSVANGLVTKLAWDYPQLLPDRLRASTPADTYTDLFLDWERDRDRPWAACINYMDAHLPYEPDREYDHWGSADLRSLQTEMEDQVWEFLGGQRPWWQRKALEALYDGTIRQIDAELERLVETLRDRGVLDDTLVVVTSDHGEGFGEVSRVNPRGRAAAHGSGIHEVLLHVPLVVKLPGQTEPETVHRPATLTCFPDAVDAARSGGSSRKVFTPDGPVVAAYDGMEEPMKIRASRFCEDIDPFDSMGRAVYRPHPKGEAAVRKFVSWDGKSAVVDIYDASASRAVSEESGDELDRTFGGLTDAGVATTASEDGLNEATKQQLERLGYR